MWSNCFSASTNARLLWDPDSGPIVHRGRKDRQPGGGCLGAPQADPPLPPARGSHRYFPGDSAGLFPTCPSLAIPCSGVAGSPPPLFIPTPPGFLPLANQQLFRSPRRASPSSLPGRLSRALSLGTIPSLTRAGKRRRGAAGGAGRQLGSRWQAVQGLPPPLAEGLSHSEPVSLKSNEAGRSRPRLAGP